MTISRNMKEWTVLIVDDAPDNVEVARKVLSFNGATVHIAEDGILGLVKLQEIDPTFILLDLSMPNMDGWQMLTEIRQLSVHKDLPVIALTAHAMEGDREKALESGFDGYIAKPFRLASFLQDILDCLDKVETQQEK